jgi:hypothetical protein
VIRIPEDAVEEYRNSVTVGARESVPPQEKPTPRRAFEFKHLDL